MSLTTIMPAGKSSCEVTKMIEKDYNDFVNEMLEDVVFLSDEEIDIDTRKYKLAEAARNTHTGRKRSAETCQRISKSQKGKKANKERIEKMRKSLTGKPWNSDLKYTDEELAAIAKKYNRRQDFLKKDRNAAKAARCRGRDFYNSICSHMTGGKRVYGTYTIAELRKRAKKFKTRSEFVKKDTSAYHQSRKMGVLDDVCKHMKRVVAEKWTKESLIKFVKQKKFKTRTEFNKKASGAYTAAWKMKLLDKLFPKK